MKKSAFIANMIVWGALSAACVAFLVWANAAGGVPDDNVLLLALNLFTRPIAAFSLAALVCGLIVRKVKLALGRRARIVWRVVGIVPTVIFFLSPFAIPLLPDEIATMFAIVLLLAMTAPVVFVLFGAFYGLSLCDVKEPAPEDGEE